MRLLLAEDEKALSSALQVILKHNNTDRMPMTTLWQGCMTESYLMS